MDRFQNSVDNCFMAAVLFLYIYVEEERKEKGKRKRNSWIRGKIIHILYVLASFLFVKYLASDGRFFLGKRCCNGKRRTFIVRHVLAA